jgi:glyoxylase-like metal-dependent hydrolase (beta-lactamase superfamily II)
MRQRLLVLCCLAALAPAVQAQEEDYSKVEIKSTQLAPGLYLLQGAGGNMAAAVGPEGAVLVDDAFAPLADKIRAAVKGLGGDSVRFVINSHYHFDHTGGNLPFAQGGSVVIGHDNLRVRLERGGTIGNSAISREVKPAPAGALPTSPMRTTDRAPERHGARTHYPQAHTDGDSVVFPRGERGAHGGHLRTLRLPFIDIYGGGNVRGISPPARMFRPAAGDEDHPRARRAGHPR